MSAEMILAHMRSFRTTFPARKSEWALSISLLLWAVILTQDPNVFARGGVYEQMSEVMPQETWALLLYIVAGARLVTLVINGFWRRSPHIRGLGAFIACLFWFEISISFWDASGWSTGLAMYPIAFFLDCFNAFSAMGEAGVSDKIHKQAARNGTHT